MRVCFWGPPARRIFGVFDEPAMGGSSDVGVVLCYPHGRDYLTAFRSFRFLATRFGRVGFHVLRFDYLGTGDSSGDVEDASIPQWIGDIVTAVNELRRSHELREISLIGLRLGVTLAALAATECQCVERLVLWEPVIDGRDYVATQRALHRAWIDEEASDGRKAPSTDEDLLGCRFTKRLCCDIEDVNLESLAKVPAPFRCRGARGVFLHPGRSLLGGGPRVPGRPRRRACCRIGPDQRSAVSYDIGWFRTGDVGFLDPEGYLFISGRIKEIINREGEKIAPSEVDHVLLEHPAVGQAVTCAVPDTRLGEDMIAIVVRRPGIALTERELREFASTRLAAFKVPRRVMFVDQIPKGPTGKIQRIGLVAKLGIESLALAHHSGSASLVAPRTRTELAIAEVWREVLAIDRVGLHDNFFELGGDSLAATAVIAQVEATLGTTINIRDMGFGTLQQVAAGCDEHVAVEAAGEREGFAPLRWIWKIVRQLRRGK